MRIKVDKVQDTLYFRLNENAIVESEEVQPGIILDFDINGKVIGVEILGLSTRVDADKLNVFQLETV